MSSYGIDKYYVDHFKGKCELLSTIYNKLSSLEHYDEYIEKLYKVLENYFEDMIGIEIEKYSSECYDKEILRIRSSRSRSSYPLYCLEMLSKEDR